MGFLHLGHIDVEYYFKPTIEDFKLLVGTTEWEGVKQEYGIDENTIEKSGVEESKVSLKDSDMEMSGMASEYKNESNTSMEHIDRSHTMLGGIQRFVLQQMMTNIVEKNDYDTSRLSQLHRQSVVFGNEYENIQTDYTQHFNNMRRKTLIASHFNKQRDPNQMGTITSADNDHSQEDEDSKRLNGPSLVKQWQKRNKTPNVELSPIQAKE